MKELTSGYPAKVITKFTIPIMLSYVLQQLYNMADGKIVSMYVGTDAFAAVGATAVVTNTIVGFVNGLTQGFAIPVANTFGARDYTKMRKYVAGTMVLSLISSAVLTILSLIFIRDILVWLDTPKDIIEDAVSYVTIILAGIILTGIYNCSANLLRAVGNSQIAVYCLLISVALNIGLDVAFINGLDMGIKGAAYATVTAQAVSAIMCSVYMIRKYKEILPHRADFILDEGQYPNLISTGLSMGLMSCIVNIGSVILQSAINGLGTAIIAAHTAARKVFDILSVMIYTFGIALTTYVSQNIGAGKVDRVRQGIRQVLVIVSIITTVLIFVCFAFGEPVFRWITSSTDPEIIGPAVMYSKISIVFFYVLGPLLILRCALQGMGRKVVPVIASVLEMLVKVLSAAFLVPAFEYVGVAFTEPISWVLMTILLATAYMTGDTEKYLKK